MGGTRQTDRYSAPAPSRAGQVLIGPQRMRSEASGSLATSLPCYNQRTAGLGQPPPCLGGGEPEARPVYGEVDRHPAEGGCGERGDTRRVRLARVRGTGRVRVRTRVPQFLSIRNCRLHEASLRSRRLAFRNVLFEIDR